MKTHTFQYRGFTFRGPFFPAKITVFRDVTLHDLKESYEGFGAGL
jgi:hypothetical protein